MILDTTTPALVLPAVSLLFLAYTHRFLHLAALIRDVQSNWLERNDKSLLEQIVTLRKRLGLIRWMQFLGALSLLLCVISVITAMFGVEPIGWISLAAALVFMGGSLICFVLEIRCSGDTLQTLLERVGHD